MSQSNRKNKRKNANYSQKSREQAARVHPQNKKSHSAKEPNWFIRLLTGKTDILDQNPNKKPFNYCILGFLIPFLCVGLAMLLRAISIESTPNSVFSILYSDAYYQYYPFFVDFRESLLSGESLLYTWNVGMGTDYIGLYAYYVASPLNLLSILIPESWLLGYYALLVPVRLGFAGLFFSIFLKKIFDRNDLSIALFGSFYATCAWAFGYLWNVMWLDTFALLPLVALGTVSILKHRKFVLYTISLFFSIFINYYIGFFTCIFTLLVFICYEICRWENLKKFFIDLCLMALFTVFAIGMTAILSLPAYASLQTTNSTASQWPQKFEMHIADEQTWKGFWDAMVKVATNTFAAVEPNYKSSAKAGGLPNIYCGLFATVFAFLFLTCKQVKWRDRICAVAMLLFLNASFIIKQLDYIWHGFHFTNEIPNRFSFLYSFVLLYMAYRAWLLRRRLKPWQVLTAMALTVTALFLSPGYAAFLEDSSNNSLSALMQNWSFSKENMSQLSELFTVEMLFPFVNGIFLLLYCSALLCYTIRQPLAKKTRWAKKRIWYQNLHFRRSLGTLGLVVVICVEFIFNTVSFGLQFNTTNLYGYPRGGEDSEKMIQYMKELEGDNSFYRAEAAQHQTYNDGALNNYNGISTFSSSANVNVTNFVRALGISGYKTYNRFAYEEASPVSHLFLNLKYILERQNYVENTPYFTDIQQSGKVHLLENNYYLPVGFMADPELAELSFADQNGTFDFQNKLLSAALGREVMPWTQTHEGQLSITSNDYVEFTSQVGASCNYTSSSSKGRIFYNYTFEEEGFFCIRYYMPGKNKYTVSYKSADSSNFTTLHKDTHNGLAYIGAVCQVYPGDEIQVTIECDANKSNKLTLTGALLDEAVMQDAYAQLSQSTLQVTKFKDTLIEGTIDCKQDGLMYTSIPQNGNNWHVYVDGEEAEITLVGDAMVGVMLTEGSHTVTFRYQNKAFEIGSIVTITCAVLFGAVTWFVYCYLKKNPGKFAKKQNEQ